MSDYTTLEVIQAFGGSNDEWGGDADWYEMEDATEVTLRGEKVPVTNVESFGGEGQGDDKWFVVKIGDQLFRKSGYYASHYGTDWDGAFEEVHPVEKVVTVYEPV